MAILTDEINGDLRIKRTRNDFRNTFLQMCARGQKINIQTLATTAGIGRKTFYKHYNTLEDLMDDVEHHIVNGILADFLPLTPSGSDPDTVLSHNILVLYQFLETHADYMQPLMTDGTYAHFNRTFRHDILTSDSFKPLYGTDPEFAAMAEGFCSCIFTIYQAWRNEPAHKGKLDLQGIATQCAHMVLHGGITENS